MTQFAKDSKSKTNMTSMQIYIKEHREMERGRNYRSVEREAGRQTETEIKIARRLKKKIEIN